MPRRDPTLPAPEVTILPEADLITRVKTEQDSHALVELVNRHSGIYFTVVNRYASAYPGVIKARDLDDEKLFNLYQFICAYDPTRGTKLSTYIGDRTDYMCKVMLRKESHNPIASGPYATTGAAPLETDDDTFRTTNGGYVTLEDESPGVVDLANEDISLDAVRAAAQEVCSDKRFDLILKWRHFAPDHDTLSWRSIGQRLGLSHEGARQIYLDNLALVKARLGVTPLT
jgi:DNA-directed RNA polymerase sigma subunit (sigma70/sigma32)